jgi:hypothetical protein
MVDYQVSDNATSPNATNVNPLNAEQSFLGDLISEIPLSTGQILLRNMNCYVII